MTNYPHRETCVSGHARTADFRRWIGQRGDPMRRCNECQFVTVDPDAPADPPIPAPRAAISARTVAQCRACGEFRAVRAHRLTSGLCEACGGFGAGGPGQTLPSTTYPPARDQRSPQAGEGR